MRFVHVEARGGERRPLQTIFLVGLRFHTDGAVGQQPALRDGNVAVHRSDRRPFQPGVGWGQLEMCAGPAPPITRLLDTKPPDAALRCVHRCSLSELEAARTLQVILCDFITSHLDELPSPQVPPANDLPFGF